MLTVTDGVIGFSTMNLISIDSPQYKRRLVRALNAAGMVNGFYTPSEGDNIRCNRARMSGNTLQVREIGEDWFTPIRQEFMDCNGQDINASIVA